MPESFKGNSVVPPIEEWDIRKWFCSVEFEQAEDTFRVVEGILQARREAQPVAKQRKRRSDAGLKRRHTEEQGGIDELLADSV